jgi:hypothetical protein
MQEQWRPIPAFAGFYEASDHGRIRRVAKGRGTRGNTVLRPQQNTSGYEKVNLSVQNHKFQRLVHALVAEAFLGPRPPARNTVNHRDGQKTNNRPSNLEYVTYARNNEHRLYELPENRLLGMTAEQAVAIREAYAKGDVSQTVLAGEYGISQNQISLIVQGKCWAKAGGPITKTGQGTRQRKLTMQQARAIRHARARGETYAALAEQYGVGQGTLHLLLTNRTHRE